MVEQGEGEGHQRVHGGCKHYMIVNITEPRTEPSVSTEPPRAPPRKNPKSKTSEFNLYACSEVRGVFVISGHFVFLITFPKKSPALKS
jgi:hypothetical protein